MNPLRRFALLRGGFGAAMFSLAAFFAHPQ